MTFYVADVELFDGTRVRRRQGVLVEHDRIAWVGAHSRAPREAAKLRAVDGDGKTLTPGLIDCHVHLNYDGGSDFVAEARDMSDALAVIKGTSNLTRHLSAGVTTVRDLGGRGTCDLGSAVEAGIVPGPRVIAAGLALTITGGHGSSIGIAREIDGADDARKAVREQIKGGARAIKVIATGGVLTPGIGATFTAMTRDELAAAVDEAHKWERGVAAHAIGAEGVLQSVRAGVDSVEHCSQLTAETTREMVARGTFRGPTLSAVRGILEHPDEVPGYVLAKARSLEEDSMASLRRAVKARVRHVVSTDAGTPFNPHGGAAREIASMVEWGMGRSDALAAATANAAELLRLPDVGRVAPGFVADLALWDGNPVDDVALLSKPRAVWKAGARI
jgi:imidazolonepropionase-like amidohydrolase